MCNIFAVVYNKIPPACEVMTKDFFDKWVEDMVDK